MNFAYYLSALITFLVETYHSNATSVCILWNADFQFHFAKYNFVPIVSLHKSSYTEGKEIPLNRLDLMTEFEETLSDSIQYSHCESFVAFGKEIIAFTRSFSKSAIHSKWRSLRNKFLFVYNEGEIKKSDLNNWFFKDLPNILFAEAMNQTTFKLWTNKFVGSRKSHPEELKYLDTYYADSRSFELNTNLYPDKTKDLMGREVISATFSYEPFAIAKNDTKANVMDVANGNENPSKRILYDGTDAQYLFNLCRLYNCTVQVDTSQQENWGFVYENLQADGILGLVLERKADIAMMAMYMWYDNYLHLDMSSVLSRSGITCLVPAPRRIISWLLPLEPFHWLLWLAIVACLAIESFGLILTQYSDASIDTSLRKCIYSGVVTSLKLFVSQGSNFLSSSVSVRIVLFSCYMIDIIITSIYSGGLASILTIPTLEEVTDSVERLAKHNMIWVGTVYNWILAINGSEEVVIRNILKNFRVYSSTEIKQSRGFNRTAAFAIERLEFGHFSLPDYLDQNILDSLKVMVDDIYYQYCVAFVPRSWALLDKFNNMLIMMHSSGLTQYIEWKVVADHLNLNQQKQVESSIKPNFDDIGPVKLGMENFVGIITILIIGIGLSTLVFLLEIIIYTFFKV